MKKLEKKLFVLIAILYSFEYDVDDNGSYGPVIINGIWNPDLAWELRRRVQGKIFNIMLKNGLPLEGWNQFDMFVGQFHKNGGNAQKAYAAALTQKTYIWEF